MHAKVSRFLILLALLVAFTVSGASAATINLKVAMWINEAQEVTETQKILDEYMAANPGVKLELIQQAWDGYHDKMISMAAAGLAPDVMVLSRTYIPSFASKGMLYPVENLLAKEKSFDVKRDVVEMVSATYNGHQYGIPIWGGPAIMAFNVDMFEKQGLPLPSTLMQSNAWTWDRLIESGKKLVKDPNGDGIYDIFALSRPAVWEPDWYQKIGAYGGAVIRDGKSVIESPEAQKGLQLWIDVAFGYHIAPLPTEPSGDFEAGTQAMYYVWSAEAPNLGKRTKQTGLNIDLAPMPQGPAGQFSVAGGCPVTVSSTSAHPEEAYKFAVWFAMHSREWQLRGIPASIPVIKKDYRNYLLQWFKSPDAVVAALAGRTDMEPSVGLYSVQLTQGWDPILASLANGQISVREATAQIARHINGVLGKK